LTSKGKAMSKHLPSPSLSIEAMIPRLTELLQQKEPDGTPRFDRIDLLQSMHERAISGQVEFSKEYKRRDEEFVDDPILKDGEETAALFYWKAIIYARAESDKNYSYRIDRVFSNYVVNYRHGRLTTGSYEIYPEKKRRDGTSDGIWARLPNGYWLNEQSFEPHFDYRHDDDFRRYIHHAHGMAEMAKVVGVARLIDSIKRPFLTYYYNRIRATHPRTDEYGNATERFTLQDLINYTYPNSLEPWAYQNFLYSEEQRREKKTKIETPYKYHEDQQGKNSVRNAWQLYKIDPLAYIEQFEKHYPIECLYQITQAIFIANQQQIENLLLTAFKERMQKDPKYWKPLEGTETYSLKKLKMPNSIKDYQNLAKDLYDKSTTYQLEAKALLNKEYGNITNKRATQREIDQEKAKELIMYSYIFRRLGDMAKARAIDPIVSVLRNQGAIDLFIKNSMPPLTMDLYSLHIFIRKATHQLDEFKRRYKDLDEYPHIQKQAKYVKDFIVKYLHFYQFTNTGNYVERYRKGSNERETVETEDGHVGIDYLEHLDELHTIDKIFKEHKNRTMGDLVEYENAKRILKIGAVTMRQFQQIRRLLFRILEEPEYKNYIRKMEQEMAAQNAVNEIALTNKNDFFPTPPSLFQETIAPAIADWISGYPRPANKPFRILEPSAGVATLAKEVLRLMESLLGYGSPIHLQLVEFSSKACQFLHDQGYNVACGDFLDYEASEPFDLIVMNPPFSKEQDIDHVLHAWKMLRLGGLLVAIMSSGAVQRSNTKKVLAFRDWINQVGGSIIENEAGAFERSDALVKTGVNTITLVVYK